MQILLILPPPPFTPCTPLKLRPISIMREQINSGKTDEFDLKKSMDFTKEAFTGPSTNLRSKSANFIDK